MPFNIFHKKKQIEQETPPAMAPKEDTKQESPMQATEPKMGPITTEEKTAETAVIAQEQPPAASTGQTSQENIADDQVQEAPEPEELPAPSKTYLKAMPIRDLADIEGIKNEVKSGNIIILRITPLAGKSIENVKTAVNDLYEFAESIGGDIARLGEERVVICPRTIRIWREKTPAPVATSEPLPTSA
jgi:uncharacterized protein